MIMCSLVKHILKVYLCIPSFSDFYSSIESLIPLWKSDEYFIIAYFQRFICWEDIFLRNSACIMDQSTNRSYCSIICRKNPVLLQLHSIIFLNLFMNLVEQLITRRFWVEDCFGYRQLTLLFNSLFKKINGKLRI